VITSSSAKPELEMKPNSLVKAPGLSEGAFGQLCSFQGPEEEQSGGTPRTVSQNSAVLVRRQPKPPEIESARPDSVDIPRTHAAYARAGT
jgi:hypothetical protein